MRSTCQLIRIYFLAALALVLSACGGGGGDGAPGAPTPPLPNVGIGSGGGTVSALSGARVVVPAGALSTATQIAITQTSSGAPALPTGVTPIGAMFAFTPHGTSFSVPVTVTVPFDPALVPSGASPALFKTNSQDQWEQVTNVSVSGSTLTANVSGFSFFQPAIPPVVRNEPQRSYVFFIDDTTLDEGSQTGGVLSKVHNFGGNAFDVDGDGQQTMEVFSSEDGVTYWVNTEDRGYAGLFQTQSFIKTQAGATLEFVITAATLEAIDFNRTPTLSECPHGPNITSCQAMYAHLAYTVRALDTAGRLMLDDAKRPLLDARSFLQLKGHTSDWAISTDDHSIQHTSRVWSRRNFVFTTSAENGPSGIHPKLSLVEPITVAIDLTSVGVGEEFFVETSVDTYATGRGRESGIGAYFRDPARVGGMEMRASGVQLTNSAPPATEPIGISGPLPCTTAPNPAAGVLQFSAASYTMPEQSFGGLSGIEITRTQGSTGAVSATIIANGGTATPGTHYKPIATTVFFNDGDTTPRTVPVELLDNALIEAGTAVDLQLSQPGGCVALGSIASAQLIILDDESPPQPAQFTIGGTVSGLIGAGLVIRDNSFRPLTPGNGPFTFASPVASGSPYQVVIVTQPSNPAQVCAINNASGVANASITNIDVTCGAPVAVGSLDSSFGEAGRVTVGLPGGAAATALQSDGKILAVGGLRLIRYNSDGTVDGSFGTAGTVDIVFGGTQGAARDVSVQTDGKILVAGATRIAGNDDFAVARYNANGTPDGSFGTAGHASVDIAGAADEAWAVLIQSDGRIVLAGHGAASTPAGVDNDFAIARFTNGGILDATFGTLGKTRTNIAGRSDLAFAAALQSDNKIVLTGRIASVSGNAEDTGIARYTANGTLDATFSGGTVRRNLSVGTLGDQGTDVLVQRDGKILIAGFARVASAATFGNSYAFALSRLNADGTVDTGFGTAGLVTTMFTTLDDFGRALALQNDGKIVVVGQRSNQSSPDFGLARYLPDGSPDTGFGNAGLMGVDFFGGGDEAQDILVQPDGKLVVSGFATNGASLAMGMIRINP